MNYLFGVPIGLVASVVLLMLSQRYVRKFAYAVDEKEKEQFKKPFHFKFWLISLITSVPFLIAFSVLGFLTSKMLGYDLSTVWKV